MLTKEPDLQKWADSILATEPSERAEMVAEDPSVFEVVRKALDAERQTTAKLRRFICNFIDQWDHDDNSSWEMGHNFVVRLGALRAVKEGRE